VVSGGYLLEGQSKAVISDVHLGQIHTKNNVLVKIEATVDQWQKGRFTLSVSLHHPDGHVMHINSAVDKALVTLDLRVDAPQLWWPNGLGEQPLYKIVLELFDGIEKLDSRTYQIGLRELELRQDPDEWGKTFTFAVNGVPIFAKGADWIPADSFITRLTHAQLEHLIRSCAQANMNISGSGAAVFMKAKIFTIFATIWHSDLAGLRFCLRRISFGHAGVHRKCQSRTHREHPSLTPPRQSGNLVWK